VSSRRNTPSGIGQLPLIHERGAGARKADPKSSHEKVRALAYGTDAAWLLLAIQTFSKDYADWDDKQATKWMNRTLTESHPRNVVARLRLILERAELVERLPESAPRFLRFRLTQKGRQWTPTRSSQRRS
jgi:hypothetical protein